MRDKVLYTLTTSVGVVDKIEPSYTLTARLSISRYKSGQQSKWVLEAELNGIRLLDARWNFTTMDSPPISLVQRALAERIALRAGCRPHGVTFGQMTWEGV